MPKTKSLDPLNIDARLMKQVSKLLDLLEDNEHVTIREITGALAAIARIRIGYVKLRDEEPANAGSVVRKYASAFAANAAGGRARVSRSAAADADDDIDSDFDEPA